MRLRKLTSAIAALFGFKGEKNMANDLPDGVEIVDYTRRTLIEPNPDAEQELEDMDDDAPAPYVAPPMPEVKPVDLEAETPILVIDMPQALWDQQFDIMQKMLGGVPTDKDGNIIVPDYVIVKFRAR
jgi:hypothetical protein